MKNGKFDLVDYGFIGITTIMAGALVFLIVYSSLTVPWIWCMWLFAAVGPFSIGYLTVKLFDYFTENRDGQN